MRASWLRGLVQASLPLVIASFAAACGDSPSTDPTASDGGLPDDAGGVLSVPTDSSSPAPLEDGATPPTPPAPPIPLGVPQTGQGTYYDATGEGNCSFDKSPQDLMVAALNLTDYAGSATCGACIAIDGPSGSVTVRVVDSCPGCAKGDVDLSKQAFEKIAALSKGRVPISWRIVTCPVVGPIAYRIKEGSSKFYTAIQVRNHKVPIAKLEYEKAGAFVDIPRKTYNYFVADKGVGDQPTGLKLRVTASNGAALIDTLPATLAPGTVIPGKAQFP